MKTELELRQNQLQDRLVRLFGTGAAQVLAKEILEKHLLFHFPENAAPICFLELPVSDNQRVSTSGFWILEQTLGGDWLASELSRFRAMKLVTADHERKLWALASMCLAETLTREQDVLGIFTEDSTFGRYVFPTLLANEEISEINLVSLEDITNYLRRGEKRIGLIEAIGGGTNLMARSTESRLEAFWRCTHESVGLGDILKEFERACEYDTLKEMLVKIEQIDRKSLRLDLMRERTVDSVKGG